MNRLISLMIFTMAALVMVAQPANAFKMNIYGVGHVSGDHVDDGDSSSMYAASNSSRLGFRGDHKINDNLTVIFQLESGVDLTGQGENDGNGGSDSDGQVFTTTRPSYVGLTGDWGTGLIGHQPALDQWANDYNLFADQVGDLGNFWAGAGLPGRLDNVMQYTTPDFGGANLVVSYVPEEGVDDDDIFILKGNYTSGKTNLGLAYINVGPGTAAAPDDNDHTAMAFTVGHDFGGFTLGGGYQTESDIGGVSGDDRDSYSFGGSLKTGEKSAIKAQYAVTEGDASDSDATMFAIGYDYALDESTTVYVAYAMVDNDDNVQFEVNGKGHGDAVTPALGDDPSALSFGIVYKFDANLVE